ncbi:MAG: D-alanine--D-alanine ligase [Lachnospiraceae bacterium]|nr:D-alanine--D-alanine ligase [Lachnospiraceae bacterium]
MNIVVLAGGLSTERDVSFKSGEMVSRALRAKGHQVIMLDVFMGYGEEECDVSGFFNRSEEVSYHGGDIPTQAPDIEKIKASRKDQSASFFGPNVIALCKAADVTFLALHGADGEDGKVQAALELMGVKFTGNSFLGCALAMDKNMAKQFMIAKGIPCPTGTSLKKEEYDGFDVKTVNYPCVVKPNCGGSSIGVTIVDDAKDMKKALDDAFFWEEEVVIEDYIKGREFSVGVVEGKALPIIEIAPKEGFYDYKNKYLPGATEDTCPAVLSEKDTTMMQKYAEMTMEALGLDTYARMDFMMDEKSGKMYCLEANTLPGMTPTSLLPQEAAVLGIDFETLCEKIIEISMKKFEK